MAKNGFGYDRKSIAINIASAKSEIIAMSEFGWISISIQKCFNSIIKGMFSIIQIYLYRINYLSRGNLGQCIYKNRPQGVTFVLIYYIIDTIEIG